MYIHAPGGIRTRDHNSRAAADLRFIPRFTWGPAKKIITGNNNLISKKRINNGISSYKVSISVYFEHISEQF
jgi:hypothetical protein